MPHCNVSPGESPPAEGSPEALQLASQEMEALKASELTRVVQNVLWIHEITDPRRPDVRQIGIGGMAEIEEIRTSENPAGSIIRNEGVREKKARGRADLIQATNAIIGIVTHTVDDAHGNLASALEACADSRACDYSAEIEAGNQHRIWLLSEPTEQARFIELMAAEPSAYVADGNHRSAAATLLGQGQYLGVFFPTNTMGLAPYNRLVNVSEESLRSLPNSLAQHFDVETLPDVDTYEPEKIHEIGLYANSVWHRLIPRADSYDESDPVETIDANIVHQKIFQDAFDIQDARDERLAFVGGNRDAEYLKRCVDDGTYQVAITLAPITIEQFVGVCRHNQIMPPKSSWFEPKIRSGLVMALISTS